MTLIAVSIPVTDVADIDASCARAIQASESGADLVEWRVDALAASSDTSAFASAIGALLDRSPLASIVTIRSQNEGGAYDGTDEALAALYRALMRELGARMRYLDIEYARHSDPIGAHDGGAGCSIILSSHDFEGRPSDLIKRVTHMAQAPEGDVLKVVWQARSLRDNLEVFDLLQERPKPMIALCMGPFGAPSRVLAPKFGGFLTFASVDSGEETAPGQLTVDELKHRYRFDTIGPSTRVYGVVGWPVAHSRSPDLQNAGFEAVDYDGVYLPLPVPPEWEHFKATLGAWIDHPRLDFRGASVTLPHKEHLVRFVRERGGIVDETSDLASAANTLLVNEDGTLGCANTDAQAIAQLVCASLGKEEALASASESLNRRILDGVRVAVLGAGGVARAACAAMMQCHASVTVFNRTPQRASNLVDDFAARRPSAAASGGITLGTSLMLREEAFDLYINCTTVGMKPGPAPDDSPIRAISNARVDLPSHAIIFDTVYTPILTSFARDAMERGHDVITGDALFLRQAFEQFTLWTGRPAPRDAMTRAIVQGDAPA